MTNPVRDLHAHSNCSDGLFAPAELVRHAHHSGVDEFSLTDHDTLAGVQEAEAQALSLGIRFMPGIEFTCRFAGQTVHVLGYGFRPTVAENDRRLTAYLDRIKARDHAWARAMCRRTCADPLVVRTPDRKEHTVCVQEDELAWVRGTMPSPFHIAVVLAKKLADVSDELEIPARHCMYLFTGRPEPERQGESYWPALRERYAHTLAHYGLEPHAHWWTPHPTAELLEVQDAVQMIERIGGIPVLAHPGEQELTNPQIGQLVDHGIRGIEVYTFKHSPATIAELESLVESLGVFATSGSDFHDPHHRAQVELGKDREGNSLTRGLSLDGFDALDAYISR